MVAMALQCHGPRRLTDDREAGIAREGVDAPAPVVWSGSLGPPFRGGSAGVDPFRSWSDATANVPCLPWKETRSAPCLFAAARRPCSDPAEHLLDRVRGRPAVGAAVHDAGVNAIVLLALVIDVAVFLAAQLLAAVL
jgi:hypothetical protein